MFPGNSYHKLKSGASRNYSSGTKSKRSSTARTIASRLPPVPEQPAKKTALTMKVKELRNWLSDLGDKHQEHYQRLHHPKKSNKLTLNKSNEGDDQLLGIKSMPSMASTCPSTTIAEGSNATDEDDREDEDSLALASKQQSSTHKSKLFRDQILTKATLDAMSHSPKTLGEQLQQLNESDQLLQAREDSRTDGYGDDDDDFSNASTLFRDQIVTKATLDAMSQSGDAEETPPKTLEEQLQQLKRHQQKRDDDNEESDYTESRDSDDASSIAPGVLVSKMANIFLNATLEDVPPPPPTMAERRKYVEPRDLSFLRSNDYNSVAATSDREDLAYAKPPRTPTTTVGKGIRKFGGPPKSLVERRKDQLQKRFGDTRATVFVQKKTWGQKTPHGRYQRTTRVEKVYK